MARKGITPETAAAVARTTNGVAALPLGARIEIEMMARKG
jgi:hypothetical protein